MTSEALGGRANGLMEPVRRIMRHAPIGRCDQQPLTYSRSRSWWPLCANFTNTIKELGVRPTNPVPWARIYTAQYTCYVMSYLQVLCCWMGLIVQSRHSYAIYRPENKCRIANEGTVGLAYPTFLVIAMSSFSVSGDIPAHKI